MNIINLADRTSSIVQAVTEHAKTNGLETVLYPECGMNMEDIQMFVTQLQTSVTPLSVVTDSLLLVREIYLSGVMVEWRNWTSESNPTFTSNIGTEPEGEVAMLNRELEQSDRYVMHDLTKSCGCGS